MKLKKTTEVKTLYKTETYELTEGINLIVSYENDVITSQVIPHKVKVKDTNKLYDYVHNINEFKLQCKAHYFYETDPDKNYWFRKYLITDYLEEFRKSEFNPDNLIIVKYYDHTILDAGGVPLDILCHSDYIGGFKQPDKNSDYQTNWDWEALKKHLENHPDILNFEVEKIPYYNSEFHGQEGLDFDYVFKSEWRNKIKGGLRGAILDEDGVDPFEVQQFILK